MKRFSKGSGQVGCVALLAALLCTTGTAAHAAFTSYGATFDSPDVVNGVTGTTTYNSPNTGVDNLDGQSGWVSTDPYTGTTANGGLQVNGGADYVGTFGSFFGGTYAGAIGGNQRNTAPSTSFPDVVPSVSGAPTGNISLYHPITVGGAPNLTLDVDLVLTGPTSFTARDTFALSLRTSTGASIISINFVPAPNVQGQPSGDNVTIGVGNGTPVDSGALLTYNSQYHLRLTFASGPNGRVNGSFTDPSSGGSFGAFSVTDGASGFTLANVGRFSTDWKLSDITTQSNGGYTGAGDNTLAFDNLVITVPEPSTYVMMALGLFGLVGMCRWQRRQA